MPPLLNDLLHQLLSEVPGVQLLAATAAGGLTHAAAQAQADVVIAEASQASPDEVCALLARRPHTRALAVSHDGRSGVLYELRPHRHAIGELSADAVLAGIAPRPPCPQQLLLAQEPQLQRPTP